MTDGPAPGDAATITLSVQRPLEQCEIVLGRGVLTALPSWLAAHAPAARYVVVSDDTVAGLHGRPVAERLEAAGHAADLLTFPAGESHKTSGEWARLVEALGDRGLGRDGCVIGVGGGVTGDLAGFAAATFARGVALVQIPTSLLAMVDAAIGGKTGVDLSAGKNLAGAFHQPRLVLIDPDVLATLPSGVLHDGLAEAVKHGLIADRAYLEWIGQHGPALLGGDPAALDRLVEVSVRIKTGVVSRDPLEAGERAILNFGHTIAHGIEHASRYTVSHGHAVAIGMVAEAAIGEREGVTRAGTAALVADTLAALRLPAALPTSADPAVVIAATRSDKKARGGRGRYVLLSEPGVSARTGDGRWTHEIDDAVAAAALGGLV
jgi:3-dehydroquinate synthase